MYSYKKQRRIKPYARPTAFDNNVVFDIRHYQDVKFGRASNSPYPAVSTDECFNVMEGEILMSFNRERAVRYRDTHQHCFSFANGLKFSNKLKQKLGTGAEGAEGAVNDRTNLPGEHAIVMLLTELNYAGVAVTNFNPSTDVYQQGFVSTVGGLNSIFNNGTETFHPGDLICASIPRSRTTTNNRARSNQTGVPPEKVQFVPVRYETLVDQFTAAFIDSGKDENEAKMRAYACANRLVMGSAANYSKMGNMLDITLHRSMGTFICSQTTGFEEGTKEVDKEMNTLQFAESISTKKKVKKVKKTTK